MASIIARKNKNGVITSYNIRVSLGYDDDGSKMYEDTSYTPKAKTEKGKRDEVTLYALEFEKAVKEGTAFTSGDQITFKKFVSIWSDKCLKQKIASGKMTKHTAEDYIRTLNKHVIPKIGKLKLNKVQAVHIDNLVMDCLNEGKSPKSIHNYFNIIHSVFDYAFRKKYISENPCLRCEPLPEIEQDGKLHTFTVDQTDRFLNEALTKEYEVKISGHKRHYSEVGSGKEFEVHDYVEHRTIDLQYRVFFTLAVYGGFRRGELIGLNWEDIDPQNRKITIRKSVSTSRDGQYIKKPKTKAGNRVLRIPESCFTLLNVWKAEQKKLCLSLGTAWEGYRGKDYDKNPIFIQMDTGKRMYVQTPTKKFKQILTAYNKTVDEEKRLPMIRLHDLRHTNASLLVADGVDFETIAKRLGHSKPSFTLNVYGHALPENDERASDKLDETLTLII